MPVKELAQKIIESLPADVSMHDLLYTLYIRMKLEKAEQEIREGRGVPHEEVKRRFQKWLR